MRRTKATLALAAIVVASGCSGDPSVTDTGYLGTWSRGNKRAKSIVSIAKVGDEFKFRWGKKTVDSRLKVACKWDGTCEEWFDGDKVADYRFTTRLDAATGNLIVEGVETRSAPTATEQRYTDVLVLEPGGKVLWSYTIERNGEKFELGKGPRRSFDKVGDAVLDPPRPGA